MSRCRPITVALAIALLAGCKNPEPSAGALAARPVSPATTDAATAGADGRAFDARVDAAETAPTVPLDDASIAATLVRDSSGEPVLVAERNGALVATNPSGSLVRLLAAAPISHGQYDARTWSVWFNRAGRLVVIDLTLHTIRELDVIDGMPDVDAVFSRAPDLQTERCVACVAVRAAATPEIAVVVYDSADGPLTAGDLAEQQAASAARPTLTNAGRVFLAELSRRGPRALTGRPVVEPGYHAVPLGDANSPLPPSARKRFACTSDNCGKSFALPNLGRSLLVVGRTCDCAVDACSAMCVWFDSARGKYAALRKPGRWAADAVPEPACHPDIDVTGTAYVIGGQISPGPVAVCTAAACRREAGAVLGWLEPGSTTTAGTTEDLSTCEE